MNIIDISGDILFKTATLIMIIKNITSMGNT